MMTDATGTSQFPGTPGATRPEGDASMAAVSSTTGSLGANVQAPPGLGQVHPGSPAGGAGWDPWAEAARQLIRATTAAAQMMRPEAPPWPNFPMAGQPPAAAPPGPWSTPHPRAGPDHVHPGGAGALYPGLWAPPRNPQGPASERAGGVAAANGCHGADAWHGQDGSTPGTGWPSPWGWGGSQPKGDYADPPAWPGWTYRKQWEVALRRWNKHTDVPVFRRAEKVLRSLGWEMQVDFEHLSEAELSSPGYLEAILAVMNLKAGVREDDEKRQAFRDVIHGVTRKKDESLGQYATRRLRDFSKAETYGISLPAEFRVSLMKEGANLTDQNLQNLAVLTLGKENDVDFLAAAMSRLDVRGDRLSGYVREDQADSGRGSVYAEGMDNIDEAGGSDTDSQDDESIPDEAVLAELEDLSFNEEQAALVFALIENRPPRRRRTWKENKLFKAEVRKDRKPFRKGLPRSAQASLQVPALRKARALGRRL